MVSGQSKMDHNNPPHHYIPLYCSQSTQTQPESDYEADSSDFSPIKIGKSMSPAAAMRRNPQQLPLSDEEPSQLGHRQHRNAGLGQNNILNTVDATAPVEHGKVIPYTLYM